MQGADIPIHVATRQARGSASSPMGVGFCLGVLLSVFPCDLFVIWLVKPSPQDQHFCDFQHLKTFPIIQ